METGMPVAPFAPVFLASIATYVAAFVIANWLSNRPSVTARVTAWIVILLGSVNLIGFPWAAIF